VLAVIAFAVRQAEEPLLEDWIVSVPERDGEAEELPIVGVAGQAAPAPQVAARSRLIVREVVPRIAARAVVFADRAPLALAEIRSPDAPRGAGLARFREAHLVRAR